MKSRLVNWLKSHKRMRVVIPSIVVVLVLLATMVPAFAAVSYLDVEGTYTVTSKAKPKQLDNSRHPSVQFGKLVITTQTYKVIEVAYLEHLGKDVALTGLVGAGARPTIVLTGTDSDGTIVQIQGRVGSSGGVVTRIAGRIMGLVESDGERYEDSADGTTEISAVAYHSEPLSCLLTAGTLASPETLLLHFPYSKLKLKDLSRLKAGQLGFWFNLEVGKGPGPQMTLRFAPKGSTTRDYYGGGTSGLVDITVMPYQAPYVGTGTWVECDLAVNTATIIYYGNDPTDYTSFGGTPVTSLAEVEAAINAEAAMLAGDDNASSWVLTMVTVELWEGGARTCYVDDVTIGRQLYTLEPNSYQSSFRATKD